MYLELHKSNYMQDASKENSKENEWGRSPAQPNSKVL